MGGGRIDFQPQDFPELVRICRLVQGMPLAIVLAAGWLEALSFKEIAYEIEQSLDFLEGRMGDTPERHSSVRAAFESSWKRLSTPDQQAFMRLLVFRGGFTRQAAQRVTSARLHSIRTLIQKSLVSVRRDGHYEIHELLRHYAAEQLEISGKGDTLRQSHSEYFLDLVSRLESDLKGTREYEALDTIDIDFENIRAAWNWALEQQDKTTLELLQRQKLAAAVGQAAECLYLFFAFRSRYPDGAELFRLARDRLSPCPQVESWAPCERVTARFAWLQTLNHALDNQLETDIHNSLALSQGGGDPVEEAFCWMVLGMYTFIAKQDPDAALSFYERSFALYQSLEDNFYIAVLLYYLGESHGEVTNLETMINLTRQSLDISHRIGNKAIQTFGLHNLARASFYAGDYQASKDYCREAMVLDTKMGLSMGIADSKVLLSMLHFLRGNLDKATVLANECIEIGREISFSLAESEALAILSLLSAVRGDETAGKKLGEESLGMLSTSLGRIIARWGISMACYGLGEAELAWSYLQGALGEAARRSFPGLLYLLIPVAVLLRERQGETERGVELLSLAKHGRHNLTGWWNCWPPLAELDPSLQARLDPEVYHSAWKRGQDLDASALIAELLPEDQPAI